MTVDQLIGKTSIFEKLQIEVLAFLGSLLLRVWNFTLRWNDPQPKLIHAPGENEQIILLFWHNRQLFMPWAYNKLCKQTGINPKIKVLISAHRDGRIIARAVKHIGVESIAGSSNRRRTPAMREMVKELRRGGNIAITPDGPRGPCYKLKDGAIRLAQTSGIKIVPICVSADRFWKLGSWDGMILPKPFANIIWRTGQPVYIPEQLTEENIGSYRQMVEENLMELTNSLDEQVQRINSHEDVGVAHSAN